MLVTITYIIACCCFVGAIAFLIVFTIRKTKQRDLEAKAFRTMLLETLNVIDNHIRHDK